MRVGEALLREFQGELASALACQTASALFHGPVSALAAMPYATFVSGEPQNFEAQAWSSGILASYV